MRRKKVLIDPGTFMTIASELRRIANKAEGNNGVSNAEDIDLLREISKQIDEVADAPRAR